MTATATEKVKERPIIFTGESVPAILEGRKTMTRRIVKPQPGEGSYLAHYSAASPHWTWAKGYRTYRRRCPYGMVGDHLWIKEAWLYVGPGSGSELEDQWELMSDPENQTVRNVWYRATHENPITLKWESPLFMPRWASRVLLEVVNVKAERVQGISRKDADAEGLCSWSNEATGQRYYGIKHADVWETDPRQAFARLWDSIHGKGAWERNDWVWAIEFKKVGGAG